MRKVLIALFFPVLLSCGGSLSKEEREELQKGSELQRIRKLGEADILEETLRQGRILVSLLPPDDSEMEMDSMSEAHHVHIHWMEPGDKDGLALEQQLIDAYLMGTDEGGFIDNVQPVGEDSILYTSPVVNELPDGTVEVRGMWSLLFSRREVVLSMD